MDLRALLKELVEAFATEDIAYALIGGLALASHGAQRATSDIDFLVDGDRGDDVDRIMVSRGYRALHRTQDVGNYLSEDVDRARVDYIFARRPTSREMLSRAAIGAGDIRVVEAEDLIGLKVQAAANDPGRSRADFADIQRILGARSDLDLERVREYFRLFEMEGELVRILSDLKGS